MATRKGPCFEFANLFLPHCVDDSFWPFFAPWWFLITVRRTPPFWKRVIRNCSWRLQDLSNLVLLTAARPRNQGFPRIAQYCRGQFFSTGLFFLPTWTLSRTKAFFSEKDWFYWGNSPIWQLVMSALVAKNLGTVWQKYNKQLRWKCILVL